LQIAKPKGSRYDETITTLEGFSWVKDYPKISRKKIKRMGRFCDLV
jgi:hypothetical protein